MLAEIHRVFNCPKENGLFPDVTNCKKYINCTQWKASYNICKTENTFWNTETLNCEPIDTTQCDPYNPFRCPLPDGVFEDFDSCEGFYSCRRNKSSFHRCPNGLHFNNEDQTCDWPQYANCQPEPDPKICINANESYYDERNCNCFFQCDEELRPEPMCCSDGMLWNEWEKRCDDASLVDCFNSRNLIKICLLLIIIIKNLFSNFRPNF